MCTCKLSLAGPAAAGKTTVARLAPGYYPVEAEECWGQPPGVERQECFLRVFRSRIVRAPPGAVLDNSLLSVYGYSMAMGLPDLAREALELWERLEPATVLLVPPSPRVLEARLERRLAVEEGRRGNAVEEMVGLHWRAMRYMYRVARGTHVPVVVSTGPPEFVLLAVSLAAEAAYPECARLARRLAEKARRMLAGVSVDAGGEALEAG